MISAPFSTGGVEMLANKHHKREREGDLGIRTMIASSEQHVNLLEFDLPGLGYEKVDEDGEEDVDTGEHVKCVEAALGKEGREELLHNGIGDVLRLRSHADGLGADVHGEDLGGPDPGSGAPRRLVKEDEEEEEEDDGDGDGVRLGAAWEIRGFGANGGDGEHAGCHADCAGNEQETTAKAISCPSGVEGEEDTAGGVEGVDEGDGVGVGEDLFVDNGRVGIEGSLAGDLLAGVDDEGDHETLADGLVLPQGRVGAGDCLGLELNGFADLEKLELNLLLGATDSTERPASVVLTTAVLHVPAGGLWAECHHPDDEERSEELKDDDSPPVPLTQVGLVLGACVVDPVGNEGTDRVESLPERHDGATNIGGGEFANVDGAGGQSNALADTDKETASEEDTELASRGEGLHKGSDDDEHGANSHANTTTEAIRDGTTEEETGNDCTNGVGSVDCTDLLRVL